MTPKPPQTSTSNLLIEVALTTLVIAGGVIATTLVARGIARGYAAVLHAFASR